MLAVLRKLRAFSRRAIDRIFYYRSLVFRYDPRLPRSAIPQELSVSCFLNESDLSPGLLDELQQCFGAAALEGDLRELKRQSCFWVASISGQVVGSAFTRRGNQYRQWFLDLAPDDIVIYRVRVHPECRGRGIAPGLYRSIVENPKAVQRDVFVDCRVNNLPSIRSIRKAGFTIVAESRPLNELAAYGSDGMFRVGPDDRHQS